MRAARRQISSKSLAKVIADAMIARTPP